MRGPGHPAEGHILLLVTGAGRACHLPSEAGGVGPSRRTLASPAPPAPRVAGPGRTPAAGWKACGRLAAGWALAPCSEDSLLPVGNANAVRPAAAGMAGGQRAHHAPRVASGVTGLGALRASAPVAVPYRVHSVTRTPPSGRWPVLCASGLPHRHLGVVGQETLRGATEKAGGAARRPWPGSAVGPGRAARPVSSRGRPGRVPAAAPRPPEGPLEPALRAGLSLPPHVTLSSSLVT